jgi:hypothetical protein
MASSPSEGETYEGSGRVSVAIWSTARSGRQHRVRLTEQAEPAEVDLVIGRALAAYRQVEAELARKPFSGAEPRAREEAAA